MHPGKLKALIDRESQNPDVSSLVGAPAPGDEDLDDEMPPDEEEEPEPVDPVTRGNQLLTEWGEQGEALKDVAGTLVDDAHEIGGNLLLATVPEEAEEALEDSFDDMPEDVQVVLAQCVAELPAKDIAALAAALIDGHDGDTQDADQKLMSTYLTKVAAYAKTEVNPDDFVEDEEDEEKDGDGGEGDGKDGDGGDASPPVAAGENGSPVASPTSPLA